VKNLLRSLYFRVSPAIARGVLFGYFYPDACSKMNSELEGTAFEAPRRLEAAL
jgi:hypothetical protein